MKSTKKKPDVTSKPHMGLVEDWWQEHFDNDEVQKMYNEKPGLGYIIRGTCIRHPKFGTSTHFNTSWVVKHDGNEIETRNSRYTLGTPRAF